MSARARSVTEPPDPTERIVYLSERLDGQPTTAGRETREVRPEAAGQAAEPAPGIHTQMLERRAEGVSLESVLAQFADLPWGTLFPLRTWWTDRAWNLLWVRWFVFFAFFPMALSALLGSNLSLGRVAWSFGLYFAVIWGLLLYLSVRPERLGIKRIVGISGFTVFVGINLLLTAQALPVVRDFYTATDSVGLVPRFFGYVFGVGLFEETTKAIPIIWLFVYRRAEGTAREILYLGAVSGLAFGVAEAVSYSFNYAFAKEADLIGYGTYVLIQLLRFISLPLLHAVWAATVAYFVALAAATPEKRGALIAVGIGSVALLHGVYDVFASSPEAWASHWGTLGMAVVSLLVFVGYVRAGKHESDTAAS